MTRYDYVLYRIEDGIAEIVLHRPDKLNAFHLPMYEEMCAAFEQAEADESVRVILLRGEGRAFCVGRDFTFSAELQEQQDQDAWRRKYKMFTRWTLLNEKMVIALVHGYALGGGGSLAAAADITIAAHGTKFGYPETRNGTASKSMIWSWLLGPKAAKEIVASGRTVDVDNLLHLGLVNRIVAGERLLDEGWKLAREIACMPVGVPEIVKRHVNFVYRSMVRGAYDDRKYDVDTASWDAAGVVPSPWMRNIENTLQSRLREWGTE
jgi:enoyl-CoA hydratase